MIHTLNRLLRESTTVEVRCKWENLATGYAFEGHILAMAPSYCTLPLSFHQNVMEFFLTTDSGTMGSANHGWCLNMQCSLWAHKFGVAVDEGWGSLGNEISVEEAVH